MMMALRRDDRLAADRRTLREMLSLPTAPFAEHLVIDYLERFCADRGLQVTADSAGNRLVHLRIGGRRMRRPVCLTAHLDHPGFVADRMIRKNRLRAFWRGGVPPEYFVGGGVRFFVEDRWVKGRIESIKVVESAGQRRVNAAAVVVPTPVTTGSVGMWDLPDPVIRGSRIYARGCDDIAGAAAMLCAIDRLVRERRPAEACFLFTRAEEVGFIGAIAAARNGTIPARCYVVSMETSSRRPNARPGDGPILRVGDKASTFTSAATAHCQRVAEELGETNPSFRYQRRLMDGGTCESSAFCALGLEAAGVCVALGNYHNVDSKRKRIAPEYIDLNDFDNMVHWFTALARTRREYTGRDEALLARLQALERMYRGLLRSPPLSSFNPITPRPIASKRKRSDHPGFPRKKRISRTSEG